MNELTFKLIVLFLPGFICLMIVKSLTSMKEGNNYVNAISAMILGFASYTSLWFFIYVINFFPCIEVSFDILKVIFDKQLVIQPKQVLMGSFWSVIVGIFLSVIINRKWFHRFMQFCKVTAKFAEVDVWSYMFNSTDSNLEWLFIRDKDFDQLYFARVKAFSSTAGECELLLLDVKVYVNSSGAFLYDVPSLYLNRDVKKILIEYPTGG